MTVDDALIAAVVAETGAIVFMFKFFLDKSRACEAESTKLHNTIEELKDKLGIKTGTLDVYQRCPEPDCPFRSVMPRRTQPLQK